VSAETNVGVTRLLDFIAKYGSSPLDRAEVPARDASGLPGSVALAQPEPVVYVFKTMNEPGVGELSLFRVYSGTVRTGDELQNTARDCTERFGQIYLLNGHDRTPVTHLNAGDLGAVVKLRATHTGDTLCSPRFQVVLPKVEFPKPDIHAARSNCDRRAMRTNSPSASPRFILRTRPSITGWTTRSIRPSSPGRVRCTCR
jgi:elongation factor G